MSRPVLTPVDFNKALPAETAEKFTITSDIGKGKHGSLKIFFAKHGEVDFTTLSVARAEQLVKQKASFIQAKTPKGAPAESK